MNDFVCPNCKRGSKEVCISLRWLRWFACPVEGASPEGKAWPILDDIVDFSVETPLSGPNLPNQKTNLEHFHCEGCGWNWFGPYEDYDFATAEAFTDPGPL